MLETVLVLASLAALSSGVWAWGAVAPTTLLSLGFAAVALGLGFGLPTGLAYHVALHRALAGRGLLPPRWWLHPLDCHPLLPAERRAQVLAWCRLGALGCAVAFLGCGVFALGAFRLALGG